MVAQKTVGTLIIPLYNNGQDLGMESNKCALSLSSVNDLSKRNASKSSEINEVGLQPHARKADDSDHGDNNFFMKKKGNRLKRKECDIIFLKADCATLRRAR